MAKIPLGPKALLAILLIIPVLSWAGSEKLESDRPCKNVEIFSEKIMKARQEGVPLTDMMEVADDNQELRHIMMEAYDYPRITTPSLLRQVIQDFKNDQALKCYKAFSK